MAAIFLRLNGKANIWTKDDNLSLGGTVSNAISIEIGNVYFKKMPLKFVLKNAHQSSIDCHCVNVMGLAHRHKVGMVPLYSAIVIGIHQKHETSGWKCDSFLLRHDVP